MKTKLAVMAMLVVISATGQTLDSIKLPAIGIAGVATSQTDGSKVNMFASGIVPVSDTGYTSTTLDMFPRVKVVNGKKVLGIDTNVRQGYHHVVAATADKKTLLLLGGDIGAGFSQASPNGTNVNLSAGFTATIAHQFSTHWGVVVPIKGVYVSGAGWIFSPAVGVAYLFGQK